MGFEGGEKDSTFNSLNETKSDGPKLDKSEEDKIKGNTFKL